MIQQAFENTFDRWVGDMAPYNLEDLCLKPLADSWSLGQIYVHLVEASNYFIEQAIICSSNNEHTDMESSASGLRMFAKNDFPDMQLEGPSSNALTKQPTSKEELTRGMLGLKKTFSDALIVVNGSKFTGKTKHAGLGYFNASQWMQFTKMHCRHHFRQQQRVLALLKQNSGK